MTAAIEETQTTGPVTKEIRFAVVMYGGISLAIYMNGIAQELLSLVRSTARLGWQSEASGNGTPNEQRFRFKDPRHPPVEKASTSEYKRDGYLAGTELVYRDLAHKLTEDGDDNRVRFIVDIISGTSAGGINGIFLAKALANGQLIDGLTDLWIEQGDIEKLLFDKKSAPKGVPLPENIPSLLNGDRMYLELLSAFEGMEPTSSGISLVEELDLYVTTTDIRGEVVPLRTADRLVFERRYKYAFHFQFAREGLTTSGASHSPLSRAEDGVAPAVTLSTGGGAITSANDSAGGRQQNDFTKPDNPFLAFAARCTSAFPFAFEPMQLERVRTLLSDVGKGQLFDSKWKDRFFSDSQRCEETRYSRIPVDKRSFGDGGYLDNKPFGYAIDALSRRSSDLPSVRKFIYIDPAPESLQTLNLARRSEPNAIENSYAALIDLPSSEPIRQDLLRINERSRFIRKINEIMGMISHAVLQKTQRPTAEELHEADLFGPLRGIPFTQLLERECPAYVSYLLLRTYDTTDKMAEIVAQAAQIERESSYFYAIRCIVRAWRELYYERDERFGQNSRDDAALTNVGGAPEGRNLSAFLNDFDVWYRIRLTRFLATQTDSLYALDDNAYEQLLRLNVFEPTVAAGRARFRFSPEEQDAFRGALKDAKGNIDVAFRAYRDTSRNLAVDKTLENLVQKIGRFNKDLLNYILCVADTTAAMNDLQPQTQDAERIYMDRARKAIRGTAEERFEGLLEFLNQMAALFRSYLQKPAETGEPIANLISFLRQPRPSESVGATTAYRALFQLGSHFLDYDGSLFPLTYGTDIGELDPIDIVRFSPEDATSIVDENARGRKKLRGITLGHFGAFMDATWREQDILWGRLDAAERIICALAPAPPEGSKESYDADIKQFVQQATDAIIAEYLESRKIAVTSEQLLQISAQRAE